MTTPPAAEHPWVVIMRRKLRERGFVGDEFDAQVERMMRRFPFLRGKSTEVDPKAEAIHRAIRQTKQ